MMLCSCRTQDIRTRQVLLHMSWILISGSCDSPFEKSKYIKNPLLESIWSPVAADSVFFLA